MHMVEGFSTYTNIRQGQFNLKTDTWIHGYRRVQDKMQVTSLVVAAQLWLSDALRCDYNGNLLKTDTDLFEKQNIANLCIYSARSNHALCKAVGHVEGRFYDFTEIDKKEI